MFELQTNNKKLSLNSPKVMGILNITPDSFSDGGQFYDHKVACQHIDEMVLKGADIIDIGGESTRPGANQVSLNEELNRVIPLVEYAATKHDVWLSIDTSKAEVMREAVNAGVHLINDVRALQEEGALEVAAKLNVPVCLMHMQGLPRSMQHSPSYQDVVQEVFGFFEERIKSCMQAGISKSNLILDVGFGFGKTLAHNYQLLANLDKFKQLGLPMLVGISRKSMVGSLLSREADERLAGSLACAMQSLQLGANILRVHDVAETCDIVKIFNQCNKFRQ